MNIVFHDSISLLDVACLYLADQFSSTQLLETAYLIMSEVKLEATMQLSQTQEYNSISIPSICKAVLSLSVRGGTSAKLINPVKAMITRISYLLIKREFDLQ
jgi:hypothetical protein